MVLTKPELITALQNETVFRAINKAGRVWGDGMSPKVPWDVVRAGPVSRPSRQRPGDAKTDNHVVKRGRVSIAVGRTNPRRRVAPIAAA